MATIKTLLNRSVEDLEKMTDAEMEDYCKPFLRVAEINAKEDEEETSQINLNDTPRPRRAKGKDKSWMLEAQRLARQYGIAIELPKELK